MKVTTCSHFLLVILLVFSTIASAQHLTISTSGGDVGPISGTNWGISDNVLYVGSSGSASINTSVITNHLQNTGDLTINLPGQSGTGRNIYINNTIAYTGSSARILTFQSGNDIVFANAVGITSATASLNIVLRAATNSGSPDNGSVTMDGINLNTKGGHIWVGGGASTATWNGLNVGNSSARTYLDDVAGISVVGSTIASGGGKIYMNALSWNSSDDDGVNYGFNVQNSNISSGAGDIYLNSEIKGRYTNGIGMNVHGSTSITSTSGAISILGTGYDQTTNGNSWRHATQIQGSAQIKSVSGNITVVGDAAFTAAVNDKEGLMIVDGASICSQTGNISLRGTNTLESSGQFSNSIRFAAADVANSIRIGYDGTNAYSGNITIEGNSIYQRSTHLGAGSIAVQTTGTLTIQPTGTAFTYMRAANSDPLTYDDDWNFGTNLGGFVYGKTTNTTNLTLSNPLTTAGLISIYGGNILAQQNITSTLSGSDILLQATGSINLAASRTIQTNNGDITFRANSGGTAVVLPNSTTGAITLNSGSSLLSTGGNITLGGNYDGTKGTGLYAASAKVGGAPGILISNATLNAAGGNINIYGSCSTSYDDGIRLEADIRTTGSGNIGIYGDAFGGLLDATNNVFFGGITFITNSSTIETDAGNINIEAKLTNTQSNGTYGLNFYRTAYSSGSQTRHIQLLSKSGNIQVTGDRGSTAAGGMGSSSWGDIYAGSPLSASWTASGNITFSYSSFVGAGFNGIIAKTTGGVTYEPVSTSFAAAQTFPYNANYILADGASSLTIGKSGNTANITLSSAQSVAGPISIYAGTITLNAGLTTTSNGAISFYSDNAIAGLSAQRNITAAGSLNYIPQSNSFSAAVTYPITNLNVSSTGLLIGKSTNTANVTFGATTTIAGPITAFGGTIAVNAALTATNSNINLTASTAATQTAAITANGLNLNGAGTFTLTNTSNNFTTLAGGAVGSLIGATQIIDVSGGLTIGTVGSNTGLTGSSTLRVETLAGNLTLAGSISTTSTSTDAVILTAAKSTAIGVPTGGDIIVSGSPTITMGSGAIAKLFSGYNVTSTGLTTLAGGASNARYNYDETTTTFNPTLSTNNKYAIYRTAEGYGDLTIVSSGGDAEGTTWTYDNGVIKTTSGTANVLNTVVQTKLDAANLSIEANKITFSANVTGSTSNTFNLLSKTHIVNTTATTITTQGGNVLFASNVDDATDNETTANGYILLGSGLTITTNGGNITLGGGNVTGTDYALGASVYPHEGIRVDNIVNLNSGGGNISMRGKSYEISTTAGAWGVGFWNLSTGSIASGAGAITLDGFSQSRGGTHNSGLYSYGALTITSANTTADAIQMIGKSIGNGGEAWGMEAESALSLLATGTGGGITVSSSQQNSANNYDIVFRGETNILAKSGPINLLGGQSGGITNGTMFFGSNAYLGSKASSAVLTSSSTITIQYDMFNFSNLPPKLATSGTLNWIPVLASFGQNVATDFFSWSQNGQTLSGLTIGKSGNIYNVSMNSVITTTGPVNVYGASIGITGALTSSGSDVSLYASTAVTQSQPIVSSGLSLNGTGTFTLTNTSNNFTTLAGGAVGSLLGATQITDVSGGLTIGTVGSNTGLKGSSTILVETLAGNLTLAGSISTTSTSTEAVVLTAAKSTAIGIGTGGDIIVSGTPTITMGSGAIAKLFSGLESTSTGLTTLAGGSSNVRNNYDETTSTFSPVLSANNRYAIYRTSAGVGALTIVSSSGDAINTTWTYDNGVINTITSPVNILSSVIENYLATGPLTINAGNTTVSSAISSASSNAFVLNANSTLSNTTPTTTVNAAITNAGSITINTGTFNISQDISTTSTAAIAISSANGFSTSTATRRTISTQGGNITLNADNDANGSGWLDIDDLTLNPGAGNLIVRGETFNNNPDQSRKPHINGTGSFTFESNDAAFGEAIGSNWFVIDQDANGISGFNFGKSGNTVTVYINSTFTVTGPINVYGGYVEVSSTITSSGNFDILLKGITNSGSCVNISGGITKSSGTGTLLMQGHGRVINSGTITATGIGVLNLVMWSDFDGDNVGGGSTLNGGSVSTNGGHVWLGGSNANGGSYTWNGLAVGDGPSTGSAGSNCHAIDLFAPITTNGGDVLLWASNNGGCGSSGIVTDVNRHINAGSGDITLIAYQTAGALELTSTGVISLLPHAGSYADALTLGGTLTSGNFSFNTSYYNQLKINTIANSGLVIGNYSGHLSGSSAVTQGNSSNVTVSSALSTKSLEIHGGAIALNENLNTTTGTSSGNVLIKGSGDVILAASKSITTSGAPVILWANSDNGATNGSIALRNGSSVVTGSSTVAGGHIWIGGGSDGTTWNGLAVGSGYAVPGTSFTPSNGGGALNSAGIYLERNSITSFGGNIKISGDAAASGYAAIATYGNTITINAGSGKIEMDGQATSTAAGNRMGILFGFHDNTVISTVNISSSSTSGDAITITGVGRGTEDAIGLSGTLNLTSSGGGNIVMNGNALGSGRSIVAGNYYSGILNAFANSGKITLNGNTKAVQVAAAFTNGLTLGPSKINIGQGGGITSSTSDVFITADNIALAASGIAVNSTGKVTVESSSSSFASALTFPIANLSLANTVSGLTLGKATNTQNVTFGGVTTIAGPITAYGGSIAVAAAISAAGDILLDGDTGNFLTQNTKGVTIDAAVTTSNNGNITVLGKGGSGTGYSVNHGIDIKNKVEAGGTGNINIVGYGGLSSNSTSSSCHGVNLDVANAWVKSNGGNVTINGFGGGASAGSFSIGVPMLNSSKVSAAGAGTVTITGTGGVNTVAGLRGVVILSSSSVYSAGGAITITGINGTNGTDYSDGVFFDNATIGSNASGAITISGQAGTGISNAILMNTTNTIGGASHANNIVLRGNNLALAGTNSVLTTGQVTLEPFSDSFTSALSFPVANLAIANTVSGLTLGKSTNTANVTFGATTTIAGPITAFGGTIAVNAALTATNSNINLTASTAATQTAAITANGLALNGAGTFTLNNTANNITKIAGGSSVAKIGSLSFVDAAGGLEIGTVNPTGITSTGPIKIETLEGNITLSENLATEDTTPDAIILNAGKTAAIGTATGGDIIVSGTPTLTYGTGGQAKLFSGRNSNSTGLTTLVGGVGNKRVSVDETTVTFSPVLANNTSYALYRAEDKLAATISNFNNFNKMYFDVTFTIAPPTSDSTGAFTYTSSNTAVATISGTTVTILSAGTSTIIASQAADVNYDTASAAATLTVSSVSVLTKGGGISSTNLNYVNKYGQIGGSFGLSANGAIVNAKTPLLSIGDSYGGGIVAYILISGDAGYDPNVQHGLIAARADHSTGIQWYNGVNKLIGTPGEGLYAGAMNTATIVAQQMSDNPIGNFAAKVCADYSVTDGSVTYSDWYLPSKYELSLMYLNIGQGNALGLGNVGGFANYYYWSSTEGNAGGAWQQNFNNGSQDNLRKDYTFNVRAVRAF